MPAKTVGDEKREVVIQPYRLVTVNELLIRGLRPWLVEGMLPAGGQCWLLGEPGVGKTFIALRLAHDICAGSDFFGRPVMTGAVLYFAGEGTEGIADRMRALCEAFPDGDWHQWFRLVEVAPSLTSAAALASAVTTVSAFLEELAEAGQALRPLTIVIDTYSRAIAGQDENSSAVASGWVEAVGSLQKTFVEALGAPPTVVVIHHPTRGTKKLRGHSAVEGAADTILQVSRDGDLRVVSVAKQKDGKEFVPFKGKLAPYGPSVVFKETSTDDRVEGSEDALRILGFLDTFSTGQWVPQAEIRKVLKLDGGSLKRPIADLEVAGVIERNPRPAQGNRPEFRLVRPAEAERAPLPSAA